MSARWPDPRFSDSPADPLSAMPSPQQLLLSMLAGAAWFVLLPVFVLERASVVLRLHEIVDDAAHATLCVPVLFACVAILSPGWFLFRQAHKNVRAVVLFAAVCSLPFIAWRAVEVLDIAFDRDAGRIVQVRYVERRPLPAGRKGSHDVVTSWRDPTKTVVLDGAMIPRGQHTAGEEIALTVHHGWLGLEWLQFTPPRGQR